MKRHALRRLRASILSTQAWSIYEPALSALFGIIGPGASLESDGVSVRLNPAAINAALGLSADMPTSSIQMVGSVAVIPVFGVLQQRASWLTRALGWTATDQLERDVRAVAANDQVSAILLYCDSPGGVAAGCQEASATIYASRKSKPVRGFVRGLCASAAYHLLSACQRIDATPSSTIGSIGTIFTHFEYADALKEMGVGVTVIKHGERKADGNPYEKLSSPAKAALQQWVTSFGELFEADVAKYRGISVADVKSRYGQGQFFIASEAQGRGLVDALTTWEQVLASLKTPAAPLPQPAQLVPLAQQFTAESALAESAFSAGVQAGVSSPPASATSVASATQSEQVTKEVRPVNKIKAWLYANGLIESLDVSDAAVKSVLSAYFAGRGQQTPEGEDKILAALTAGTPAVSAGASAAAPSAAPSPQPLAPSPSNNSVQAAHDREVAEARAEAARNAEQQLLARQTQIRQRGRVLGISAEAIEVACSSNKPLGEVLEAWTADLARENPPVGGGTGGAHGTGGSGTAGSGAGGARVTGDGAQRYMADAAIATLLHFNQSAAVPEAQVTPQIRQLATAPMYAHAQEFLRMAGIRVDNPHDREEICQRALEMDGPGRIAIHAEGGIAYNRPGSFPNLLSALANKVLDEGVELADVSYPEWTGLWPGDLPDFKPAPVVAKGTVGELDEVLDAEVFKEQKLDEECLSYMQLARYGNHVKLTPVLLANDDLGAFMEDLLGLGDGWELTVNRGCLRIVTGNVTLLDGVALYDDATHGNLITAGGAAPSTTSWDAMQQKMAAQQTIGNKGRARSRLSIALVPPKHEVAAIQTFAPLRDIAEQKQAAVDSNLNVFRGRVKTIVEPDLQDFSNDIWYGFTDPRRFRNATIIRAYFRGWGRRGKRERWYDPMTKCYYVSLEGRAGFAAKQYRTTVRNPGT